MFEHVVDALFRSHGYQTQTNVLVVGRSGARHEVDVLASRSEGLVDSRIGVECKNWAQPVDTAVVARARLVRDDLGLGQMVIACPSGATPAARTTAREMGIAIWDRTELEARLGATTLAALGPTPVGLARRGRARQIDGERAERTLRARGRGPLGLGRERVRWIGDAWITLFEARFGCGERTGIRQRLHVRPSYSIYESLGATGLWTDTRAVAVDEIATDDAPSLPCLVSRDALASDLARIIGRGDGLVQTAALERHHAICEERLLPEATHLSVDEVTSLEWPITVAVLDDRRGTRAIVVDGVSGRIHAALGERCTAHIHVLSQHLGIAQSPTGAGSG